MAHGEQVKEFWDWFAASADGFGERFDNQPLIRELDERVTALGGFAWELGPGLKEKNALVISPAGDRRRLTQTRNIIAQAPTIAGWEFHPAKPPKQWGLVFEMEAVDGATIQIDARDWRYVLLRHADGGFEVLVEAPNLADLSDEDRISAAEIVLDGVLGEQRRLEMPAEVGVIDKFDGETEHAAKPIKMIADLETTLH